MKRIVLAIAFVVALGFVSNAQYNDHFFMEWEDVNNGIEYSREGGGPGFPGGHGGGDTPVPLGSGLTILAMLGAGYAVARRKREE